MSELKTSVELLVPSDAGVEIFDYSTQGEFEQLWDLPTFDRVRHLRIIVIWPGTVLDTSSSKVNLASVLTPVDWAIAYASRTKRADLPWVLVLDAGGSTGESSSLAHLESLRSEELPWLRVEKYDGSLINLWLRETQNDIGPHVAEPNRASIKRFLRVIKTNLTQEPEGASYNHHALANVVGPMILLGDVAKPSLHARALLELVRACGLAPAEETEPGDTTAEDAWRLPKNVELILLDDQADQGWKDWVEKSLKLDRPIVSYQDPNKLLAKIEAQLKAADREQQAPVRDLRFRLRFDEINRDKIPVLLLDLRLFPSQLENERRFYIRLLKLAVRFKDKDTRAWNDADWLDGVGFKKAREAIEKVEGAATLGPETPEHREALTWLSRLLALVDMSLPIVLFSSTERKSLITPLRHYRSIFVSFQKPSLLSLNLPATRQAAVAGLRQAVDEAARFGSVRQKCRQIRTDADKIMRQTTVPLQEPYIELFVDETGTEDKDSFAIGGIFALFEGLNAARKFDDCCVESGLRYFDETLFEKCSPHPTLLKWRDNGAVQLKNALDLFRSDRKNGQIALGRVLLRRPNQGVQLRGGGDERDGLPQEMLAAIVELFCAESLPAIAQQYGVSPQVIQFSVYLATRLIPVEDPQNPPRGEISYRDGIEIQRFGASQQPALRSIGERDAFPIVRTALRLHPWLALQQVHRAVAVVLAYKEEPRDDVKRIYKVDEVRKFEWEDDVRDRLQIIRGTPRTARGTVFRYDETFGTLHVTVAGLPEDVICISNQDHNRDLSGFKPGDSVRLDVSEPQPHHGVPLKRPHQFIIDKMWKLIARSPRGDRVLPATPQEVGVWAQNHSPNLKKDFVAEIQGIAGWRPDYRALHYVADQILRKNWEFAASVSRRKDGGLAGQFVSRWNKGAKSCRDASRLLDQSNSLKNSVRLYQSDPADLLLDYAPASWYFAGRLWERLEQCRGDDLLFDPRESLEEQLELERQRAAIVAAAARASSTAQLAHGSLGAVPELPKPTP